MAGRGVVEEAEERTGAIEEEIGDVAEEGGMEETEKTSLDMEAAAGKEGVVETTAAAEDRSRVCADPGECTVFAARGERTGEWCLEAIGEECFEECFEE